MTLQTIQIGGKERPVHFGHWALKTLCEILRIEYAELVTGTALLSLDRQLTAAVVGLQEGARLANRSNGNHLTDEPPIDEMTVADWLDEDPDGLENIMGIYFEQVYGRAVERLEKTGKQKEADILKNALAEVRKASPSPSDESAPSLSAGSDSAGKSST